jgi:hypothetical protein
MGNLRAATGPALMVPMTPNQTLIRRRDPHRSDCWLIYFGDVHVGSVGLSQCLGLAALCGYTE